MLHWLYRLLKSASAQPTARRLCLAVEALEERCTPADISFAFAVSQTDRQVYIHVQDIDQPVSGTWTLTAPGQFQSVVADTFSTAFGTSQAIAAFAIGVDEQVYEALFDFSGRTIRPWLRVAPGAFDSLVVGTYGVSHSPILFGVSTSAAGGQQVFAATFNQQGNLINGWFAVAPGLFESLAMANFGRERGVALFGVGVDHRAYEARFDANGNFIDGWVQFAPGVFQSLGAAERTNNFTLELFGAGTDGQAYAANFASDGLLVNGWFPVNTNQPSTFTQVLAAPLGNGNTMAFGLGTDFRAYYATFTVATGVKISGWTPLPRQFTQLAAGDQSGRAKLYALGRFDLQVSFAVFDASGNLDVGLTPTPAGRFTYVDVAP